MFGATDCPPLARLARDQLHDSPGLRSAHGAAIRTRYRCRGVLHATFPQRGPSISICPCSAIRPDGQGPKHEFARLTAENRRHPGNPSTHGNAGGLAAGALAPSHPVPCIIFQCASSSLPCWSCCRSARRKPHRNRPSRRRPLPQTSKCSRSPPAAIPSPRRRRNQGRACKP